MKRFFPFVALLAIILSSVPSCQRTPVVIPVSSISFAESKMELTVGEQIPLDPVITPDNATNKDVIWTSDNEAVASVSTNGIVIAHRAGKANITATTVDQAKTAACAVEVKAKMGAVTGEASHISCRNAQLSGKVNLPQTSSTNLSFGVLYSTSSDILLGSATELEAKDFDADYNYTIDPGVLEPETTYYYRSYIIQNDEVEYGQIQSFTTLAVSSLIQTLDAGSINPKDATLNASLNLTDCRYESLEYGFEFTPEGGQTRTLISDNYADNSFSYQADNLTHNTKYSYAAYVKLDDIVYKGEPKTFSTLSIQASVTAEASDLQPYSAKISGSLNIQSEGVFRKWAVLYFSSSESTLEGLRSKGTKVTLTLGSDGSYSETLSALTLSTAYNFVVVAKVDNVEFASQIGIFSTTSIQASVTAEASDVKCISAKISARLNIQSEGVFSKWAVLYFSSSESTLEGLRSKGKESTLTLKEDGSFSTTLSSLSSSTSYNFVVVAMVDGVEFASQIGNFSTLEFPIPSQVDLGLSVKWASCNLGASKPTEYGGYYQWAGTKDVSDTSIYLDWYSCPCHTGDYKLGWSKYNTKSSYGTVDNKTVLEAKDDAATVALGGNWRIPTDEEWAELRNTDNCSWTWTTIDGVRGYKVQSKKSGYTDKWIFLPAAGIRNCGDLVSVQSSGNYWSSSLDTDSPSNAYDIFFGSGFVFRGSIDRYYGQSVRPVSE